MTNSTSTATAYLCDACMHAALGTYYADDLTARMGAAYTAAKRAALEAMGEILDDLATAPRIDRTVSPCTACGDRVNGVTVVDYRPAAPAAARETLATATHDGHAVTVTRDEPLTVGNGMPYTVVRVNGIYMGEVIGSRPEDDGTLTARVRVPSGYDKLTYSGNGPDFAAALAELAPHIVAAYRRTYPRAA